MFLSNIQEKVNTEKQKIVSIFEEAEVHLKQEKTALLDQLEELVEREEAFVTKLSGDICLCDTLIQEMEEKNRQPPSTFVQVRSQSLLESLKMKGEKNTFFSTTLCLTPICTSWQGRCPLPYRAQEIVRTRDGVS